MRFSGINKFALSVFFAISFSQGAYCEKVAERSTMAGPAILAQPAGVGSHPVQRLDEKQGEFAELRNLLGDLFAEITGLSRNSFEVRWDYRERGVVAAIVTTERLRDAELAEAYGRGQYKALKKLQDEAKNGRIEKPAVLLVSPHLVDWALEQVVLKDPINGTSETRAGDDSRLRYVLLHEFGHNVSSGKAQTYFENPENWSGKQPEEWYLRAKRQATERAGSKGYEVFSDLFAQEQEIQRGGNPIVGDEMTVVMQSKENSWASLASAIEASHPKAATRLDFLQADRRRLRRIGVYRARHDNYQRSDTLLQKLVALRKTDSYERDVHAVTQRLIDELEDAAVKNIRRATLKGPDADPKKSNPKLSPALLDVSLRRGVDTPYDSHLQKPFEQWLESAAIPFRQKLMTEMVSRLVQVSKELNSPEDRLLFLAAVDSLLDEGLQRADSTDKYLQSLTQLRDPIASAVQKEFVDAWYGNSKLKPIEILTALKPGYSSVWVTQALREFEANSALQNSPVENALEHLATRVSMTRDKHTKGDEVPLHRLADRKGLFDFFEVAARLYPAQVAQNLLPISKILKSRLDTEKIPTEQLQGIRKALQSAVDRIQWKDIESLDVSSFLSATKDIGLDISAHRAALEDYVRREYGLKNYTGEADLRDLLELAEQHPQMKAIVTPLLAEYLRLGQDAFEDRVRFESELEAVGERYSQTESGAGQKEGQYWKMIGQDHRQRIFQFLSEIAARRAEYGELEAPIASIEKHLRAQLAPVLKSALHQSDKELSNKLAEILRYLEFGKSGERANKSLVDLIESYVPRPSYTRDQLTEQFRISPNMALRFALMRHGEYPELVERIRPLRLSILNSIFGEGSPNAFELRKLISRLYTEDEARKALQSFLEIDSSWASRNPSTPLAHIFGYVFTPKDLVGANVSFRRKAKLIQDYLPSIETEADLAALLTIVRQGEQALRRGEIEFQDFFSDSNILLKQVPRGASFDGFVDHARDAAVYGYLRSLSSESEEVQIEKLEKLVFDFFEKDSPYQRAAIEQLEKNVPAQSVGKRIEWLKQAAKAPYFKGSEFVNRLFEEVLKSKHPIADRLEWMKNLQTILSAKDLQRAWTALSPEAIYSAEYDPQKAKAAIHAIYGDYFDGMAQKLNEVMEHYELDEPAMRSLRKTVFGEKESAIAGKELEIIRLAIEANLTDDATHLEFIRWLQGKTTAVPSMANEIIDSLHKAAGEYWEKDETIQSHIRKEDFVELVTKKANTDRLLDTYRNNPMLARAAMISPIFSSNQEGGMFSRSEGLDTFIKYVTDGMQRENIGLARGLMRSYLRAMGRDAHLFASQVIAGANSRSADLTDAEKLKAVLEGQGALWIKLGQQLYADKHLIPNDSVREIFKTLLDNADKPYRERLFKMLRAELGDQFEKITHVERVFGSGSVNISVGVQLKNGKRYVARFVRDDPWSDTEAELLTIRQMRQNLLQEADETHDVELRNTFRKISAALEEHLEGIGRKIQVEADLRIDRRVTEKLRQAGTYHQDYQDLGVHVRLVTEATDTGIEFTNEENPKSKKLAKASRVILYPYVPNEIGEFSPAEKKRALQAALRAEYNGLFKLGAYDPDGHLGNWRIYRDPRNPGGLVVHRIDTSQSEFLEPNLREAFRAVIAGFAGQQPKTLFENYVKLIEYTGDRAEFEREFNTALKKIARDSTNPISRLVDVHTLLKHRFGAELKMSFPIQMALKSLHTTQQLLDARMPAERALYAEEFAVSVLNQSRTRARITAGLVGAKAWWDRGVRAAESWLPEKDATIDRNKHHEFLDSLAKMNSLTESRWEDLKEYTRLNKSFIQPISEAILRTLTSKKGQVESDITDEVIDKLVEWSPEGLSEQLILEKLARTERLHALERLAHKYPQVFVKLVPELLAQSDTFVELLKHNLLYTPELREAVGESILKSLDTIPYWNIAKISAQHFPQVVKVLPSKVPRNIPLDKLESAKQMVQEISDPHQVRVLRQRIVNTAIDEIARRAQMTPEAAAKLHTNENNSDLLWVIRGGWGPGIIPFALAQSDLLTAKQQAQAVLQLDEVTNLLADPKAAPHFDPHLREDPASRMHERRSNLAEVVQHMDRLHPEALKQIAVGARSELLSKAAVSNLEKQTRQGKVEETLARSLLVEISKGALTDDVRNQAKNILAEGVLKGSLRNDAVVRNLPDGYRLVFYPGRSEETELHLERVNGDGTYSLIHTYPDHEYLAKLVTEPKEKPSPRNALNVALKSRTLAGRLWLIEGGQIYDYLTAYWPEVDKDYVLTKQDAKEFYDLLRNPPPSRTHSNSSETVTRGLSQILRAVKVSPDARQDLIRLTPYLDVKLERSFYSSDSIPDHIQIATAHRNHRDEVLRQETPRAGPLPVADFVIASLSKDGLVSKELDRYLKDHLLSLNDALRINEFLNDNFVELRGRDSYGLAPKSVNISRVLERLRFADGDAMMVVYRYWRSLLSANAEGRENIYVDVNEYSAHGKKELDRALEEMKKGNTDRLLKHGDSASERLAPYAPYDCVQNLYRLAPH